ncbi:MAG: hypothetical protein R3D67_03060 [Hyphomicrobiaceae bacterium]
MSPSHLGPGFDLAGQAVFGRENGGKSERAGLRHCAGKQVFAHPCGVIDDQTNAFGRKHGKLIGDEPVGAGRNAGGAGFSGHVFRTLQNEPAHREQHSIENVTPR